METTAQIDIERPAEEVFDYVADMARNPDWQQGQQRCTWTSEPPVRVGSTYDQEARFLGRRIVSSFEVVEYEPGRCIRIKTIGGTMPIDVTRSVEPLGPSRCRVWAVVRGEAPGPMRLLGPLLPKLVGRSVRGDYRRLKALLEGAPA